MERLFNMRVLGCSDASGFGSSIYTKEFLCILKDADAKYPVLFNETFATAWLPHSRGLFNRDWNADCDLRPTLRLRYE
jgi:hypothetical protein